MFSWWSSLDAVTRVNVDAQWALAIAGFCTAVALVLVAMTSKQIGFLQGRDTQQARGESQQLRERLQATQQELEETKRHLAWRTLSPQQQASIAAKLASLKGQEAAVGANPVTAEGVELATQIVSALKAAGWVAAPRQVMVEGPLGGVASGVIVRTTADPRSIAAASALVNALNAEGIVASQIGGLPFASPPSPGPHDALITYMVLVIVGDKPQ